MPQQCVWADTNADFGPKPNFRRFWRFESFFAWFFSETESEKRAFGACDNLPHRQDGVMAEKMRGCS